MEKAETREEKEELNREIGTVLIEDKYKGTEKEIKRIKETNSNRQAQIFHLRG